MGRHGSTTSSWISRWSLLRFWNTSSIIETIMILPNVSTCSTRINCHWIFSVATLHFIPFMSVLDICCTRRTRTRRTLLKLPILMLCNTIVLIFSLLTISFTIWLLHLRSSFYWIWSCWDLFDILLFLFVPSLLFEEKFVQFGHFFALVGLREYKIQQDAPFVCRLPSCALLTIRGVRVTQKGELIHARTYFCLCVGAQVLIQHQLNRLIFVEFYVAQVVIVNVDFVARWRSIAHFYLYQAIFAIEVQSLVEDAIIASLTWVQICGLFVQEDLLVICWVGIVLAVGVGVCVELRRRFMINLVPLDQGWDQVFILLQKGGDQVNSKSDLDQPISHRFHPLEILVVLPNAILEEHGQHVSNILSKNGLIFAIRSRFQHVLKEDQEGLYLVVVILVAPL